jgi:hypothetical protein
MKGAAAELSPETLEVRYINGGKLTNAIAILYVLK